MNQAHAHQGQTIPTDRQRQKAESLAQRAAWLLNDLRGSEHLLDDARLAILAGNLRDALKRLEAIKEVWAND